MKTNMIKPLGMAAIAVGLLSFSLNLHASNSADQTVTFSVSAINEIAVSGNPGALTVSTATAGQSPDQVTDSSSTYDLTTNESSKKIAAALDSDMPAGTMLKVNLQAPAGATSAGDITLSSSAADAVTGIDTLNVTGRGITYKFSATSAAGVLSADTRTVTLTVTD